MPFALWVGRLCEAFQCLPSAALAEYDRLPVGVLEEIIEARAFARMKGIVDRARRPEDIPDSPLADLVKAVIEAAALEEIAGTHARSDD